MSTPLFQRLRQCEDLHAAASCILDECLQLGGTERGNVQLLDETGEWLLIAAQRGFDTDFLTYFARVSVKDGSSCGQAMLARKPIIIADIATDPSYADAREAGLRAGYRAVISIPIIAQQRLLVGMQSLHFASQAQLIDLPIKDLLDVARAAATTFMLRRLDEQAAIRLGCTQAAISASHKRIAVSRRILRR